MSSSARNLELYEKVYKVSQNFVFLLKSFLNDASVGLFRVQEHVFKRIPFIVKQKKLLQQVKQETAFSEEEVKDIKNILLDIQQDSKPSLEAAQSNLEKSLLLLQQRKQSRTSANRFKQILLQ